VRSGADDNACVVDVIAACEGVTGKERLTLILSAEGTQLTLQQPTSNTCAFGTGDYYRVP
jgi:hypothetical protein